MNNKQVCEVAGRETQVREQLSAINSVLIDTEQITAQINTRLSSVLVMELPTESYKENITAVPQLVSLAEELRQFYDRVSMINDELRNSLDRLEL